MCQIDDDRGIKTSGYLYVEGMSGLRAMTVDGCFF